MTQEEKNLLLEDLCNRLSYGVKCNVGDETPYTLSGIEIDYVNGHLFDFVEKKNGLNMQVYLSEIKPYLFPLSSMTEEQMAELEELCDMYTPDDDYWSYAYKGITVLYKHVLDDDYKFNFNTDVIDWLHKNNFDYRGLIPMGLANDATGLNIY